YSFFMLTKILLVLVAIVIILLVVAYFTPRNFSLSKSITINAPRETVYDYVRFLKSQEKYSVWVMADPNIAMQYTGTDGAVGATSSWKSEMKNVGVGAQTVTTLVPNEKVTVEIRFEKPMKATNYADTTLEVAGGQTKVTNTFYGTNKFPMNITNLFLDKMIGGDIEKNMENLKKNLETK
ncbi:SRPBCC family protein, partial [Candidatus Gracilibacteria bacterium]|nr:SRPBCC family protein [Candidatus Gracilibacteria bacterium]